VASPVHPLASPGILLGIAIGIAPVIVLMTSAQPQSLGPTFFFLYFLSFLFFYIYSLIVVEVLVDLLVDLQL
jgi:hypothetical protein